MLRRIETVDNIPGFLEGVKDGEEKLMGFGHRVYKNYDPRARIIKKHVDEVLDAVGIKTTRCSRSPPSWRSRRSTTTTSPRASSIRTSTSTPA